MIIHTQPYDERESKAILEIRCEEEDVDMSDDAKDLLCKIACETSLRYAIQLISAASLRASKRKSAKVDIDDVSKVYGMFLDVKRSTQFMIDNQAEFVFNEAAMVN